MNDFERFERKFRKFDVNRILREVWRNPAVQNFIIELNTEGQPTSQLFEKGEDAFGESLGDYSLTTILGTSQFEGKLEKGQRIDHITLRDTGDFYETFVVTPLLNGFRLTANGDKGGGDDLLGPPPDGFGENVVGLNEENLLILCRFIQPFFIAEAKKVLS